MLTLWTSTLPDSTLRSFGSVALRFVGLSVIRFSPEPANLERCLQTPCLLKHPSGPAKGGWMEEFGGRKIKSLRKVGSVPSAAFALACKSVNKILQDFSPKG